MQLAGLRGFVYPAGATTSWETRSASLHEEGRVFNIRLLDLRVRAVSEVTLSGGTACFERPPAKLPARSLPGWLPWLARGYQHVSIWKKLWPLVVSVSGVVLSVEAALRGRREAKKAQRESKEGRTQAAADRMMEPFTPQKKKAEVVQRSIMKAIEQRILGWDEHATIIAGRFGSGKSVAVEEALRDMQGVFVHKVNGNDWEEKLYKRLGLDDGPDMLEKVLRRVGGKLQRPPILVLDIPRTTKQGGGRWGFRFPLLLALLHSEAWIRFPASPRICRRTVSWPTPGPEDSAALFCCAAVGSCASCPQGFFRGDRLRLFGCDGHLLRRRWQRAPKRHLGGRLD